MICACAPQCKLANVTKETACCEIEGEPAIMAVVYLDYNSTSPLAPEVLETVSTALRDAWANPNSSHAAGETPLVS